MEDNEFDREPDDIDNQGCCEHCCSRFCFFMVQGGREIKHRCCSFTWAFLSILLVTIVTAVAISMSDMLPVITLMLTEDTDGQTDMVMTAGSWTDYYSIDYDLVSDRLKDLGDAYNRGTPRCQFSSTCYSTAKDGTLLDTSADTIAFDTLRERELQIGRIWEMKPMAAGECVLTEELASRMEVKVGDTFELGFNVAEFSAISMEVIKEFSPQAMVYLVNHLEWIRLPLKVVDIITGTYGKSSDGDRVFVEFDQFWPYIVKHLPQTALDTIPEATWTSKKLVNYAQQIVFSYTYPRHMVYIELDSTTIAKNIVEWGTKIAYALNFGDVTITTPVLSGYAMWSMLGLAINMISSIIVVVLAAISILLIYSLLMISVESRTFEIGILRMVGLNRPGVVGTLTVQAALYTIPGWIIGLILSYVASAVVATVLGDLSTVPLNKVMPWTALLVSTLIVFIVTLVASFFPIRHALSQNLHDSIDVTHPQQGIMKVSIERAEDMNRNWGMLGSGFILALLGLGVYIVLPQSLISLNITLMAFLFFGLILIVLIGLILIMMNFEYVLERVIAAAFIFWETSSIRNMAKKNLGAHRQRNRKTTMLYSISLSFIVFVTVLIEIAISSIVMSNYMNQGCDIYVRPRQIRTFQLTSNSKYNPDQLGLEHPDEIEAIVAQYDDILENVAWATEQLEVHYPVPVQTQIANIGRSHTYYHQVIGLTPNWLNGLDPIYVRPTKWTKTGENLIEQLYTQNSEFLSTILCEGFRNDLEGKLGQKWILNLVQASSGGFGNGLFAFASNFVESSEGRYNVTTAAFFESLPWLDHQSVSMTLGGNLDAPFSIPAFLSLYPDNTGRFETMRMGFLFIRLKAKADPDRARDLVNELKGYRQDPTDSRTSLSVSYTADSGRGMTIAEDILDVIMIVVTILVMVLCFFSLMSSMNTNILESTKEIGIMRALGFNKWQLVRLYSEEAFILVITASLMGIVVGMVVGYLLMAQISVLQGLPIPLFVPWQLILIIVGVGLVTSIISALIPTLTVVKMSIVKAMKTT
ncbi:putative DUF214 family protein [Blattamonas nauphoetae]|uniref:DUF214 family protein n=1 Tax=Blattamonas nauphoetae TaxID=2049346 RepID=A0ABQ9XKZ5_9EUKA|nr:putative DUF214 family protein [Blattamonas nauphoetae]